MEVYIGQDKNRSSKSYPDLAEIEVRNLKVRYPGDDRDVLNIEDLIIPKGQTLGIIGSSGAGKTTFLRTIGGFVKPYSGSVTVLTTLGAILDLYSRTLTLSEEEPSLKMFFLEGLAKQAL